MSEATRGTPPGGFSVRDCDRYLEHLTAISTARRLVVAHGDVFNEFGVLLLHRDTPLGHVAFERMRGHRLARPVDEAFAMRQPLDERTLRTHLDALLAEAPDLHALAAADGCAARLDTLCVGTLLQREALQKLSVLELVLPQVFHRALFTAVLAAELAHQRELPETDCRLLFESGLLHDLGLLHIDPALATRTDELDDPEWQQIVTHAAIGATIAAAHASAAQRIGRIVAQHHERTDGTGGPHGLAREAIDPLARLLALADMVHALRFENPPPGAGTLADCVHYLRVNRSLYGEANYRAASRLLRRTQLPDTPPAAPRLPRLLLLDTNRSLTVLRERFTALAGLLPALAAVGDEDEASPAHTAPLQHLIEQFVAVSDASGLGVPDFAPHFADGLGEDPAALNEVRLTAQELLWLARRIERQLGQPRRHGGDRVLRARLDDLAHATRFELRRAWQRLAVERPAHAAAHHEAR